MNSTKQNSNHFLESALRYARNGRKIFPILDGQKYPPLIKGWGKNASSDAEQIKAWWSRWPNANIGLACMASGISVIDIDKKPDGSGEDTIKALAAEGKVLTPTKFIWTPRGGRHLWYRGAIATTTGKLGKYVDTRGTGSTNGGYVLLPPSRTADGVYRADNNNRKVPIAPVDPWVVEMCGDASEIEAASQVPLTEWDLPVNIKRARDYLKTAPVSKQGAGGGDLLVKTIAPRLKDMAISEEIAVEILTETNGWNSRSEPPWSLGDDVPDADNLAVKVHNGYIYCTQNPPGIDTSEADFAGIVDTPEELEAIKELAAETTAKYKGITLDDFVLYLPENDRFIYMPKGTDDLWPGSSVDITCPGIPVKHPDKKNVDPALWESVDGFADPYAHKKNGAVIVIPATAIIAGDPARRVAGMTWWPGEKQIIRDKLIHPQGGVTPKRDVHFFNRYLAAPKVWKPGNVTPWLEHVQRLYPKDWQHMLQCFAWRVQRPDVKINHALVLGGATRIGKDTILKPVEWAVGLWNVSEVDAVRIMTEPKFNAYLEAVICQVNEAKDYGEFDRYGFYERMKPWLGGTALPVLMVADKYVRAHPVLDVVWFVITTNHKARGLFLPSDDARHYVAWSDQTRDALGDALGFKTDGELDDYFVGLYRYYENGGNQAVANYLRTLELNLNPKAPPPKTDAWFEIVNAYNDPVETQLSSVIESISSPDALTPSEVSEAAFKMNIDLGWTSPKGRNQIAAQLETVGYVAHRCPSSKDGYWNIGPKGKRTKVMIYVKASLSPAERLKAAQARADAKAKNEQRIGKAESVTGDDSDFAA